MPCWILIGGHPLLVQEDLGEVKELVDDALDNDKRWILLTSPSTVGWDDVEVRADAVTGILER
jgi:hypothetical protein